ncbi:hypothetical protein Emag_003062 [Eimeria magna]
MASLNSNASVCPNGTNGANPGDSGCMDTHGDCSGSSTWTSHGVQLACGMCVCVVGGGNIAGATAAWLSRPGKNLRVHVLTRQPQRWVPNMKKVAPHLKPGCVLGTAFAQGWAVHTPQRSLPGVCGDAGGFDWAVEKALGAAQSQLSAVFGLQHVPWLARWEDPGKAIEIIGPKRFLCAAVSPPCAKTMVQLLLQLCFDQPCKLLPNFLCLTLTPSNQIIHPARYYSIFKDWDGVRAYREDEISWGLYTEFDAEAAKHLGLLDAELQAIKKAIIKRCPNLDLSTVMPIQERIIQQYGDDVKDRSNLQMVVSSNKGYASCRTPATAVPGGFHPSVSGRLFQEDVPSGLCVLKNIAEMVDVATPTIDLMIEWHQKFMGQEFLRNGKLNPDALHLTTAPARYGITTIEQLASTTLRACSGTAHASKI